MLCTGWGSWSDASCKHNRVRPPTKVSRKEKRSKHTVNEQQDKKFMKHMVCVVHILHVCVGYHDAQSVINYINKNYLEEHRTHSTVKRKSLASIKFGEPVIRVHW